MSEKNRKPDAVFRLGLRSLLPTDKTEQDARKTRRASIFDGSVLCVREQEKRSATQYFATYFPLARPNGENRARRKKDKENAAFPQGAY